MSRKLMRPTDLEDQAITAAALTDTDNPPFSDMELAALRPRRGRPPKARPKIQVSIRYSADVIDFFKSGGEGWQARMDDVLSQYVNAQKTKLSG
ncbi:MAG: BrnA antitoxin family protein [Burkholderiaceae bacterium]